MATKYPEQIDGNSELPLTTDNVTPVKAEVVNNLRGAILAIERELGADPSREFGTVRTRLDALETRIASLESSGGGGGGPGTLTIKSSGSTVVSAASILDFIGADVVLSDAGTAQITILGGGADSKQESVSVSNGQTSFSLAETPLEANTVMMFVNGAKQEYNTDYTVSGTTVTWNDTFVLQSTDIVEFWYLVEGSGGSSGGEIGSLGEVLTQGNTSDGYDILLSAGDDLVLSSTSTITSSGSLIELAKDTKISGELTLTGILDETTGLRLLQQGSIPASATPRTGVVWIRSSDKKLIYTDDDSTTHILNPDSGGTPTWAQILASGADSGSTNPRITSGAVLLFQRRPANDGAIPDHGYLWVKDDIPTTLYFTDSAGTDYDLTNSSGDATSLLSIDLDTTSFGSPTDGYVITYDSGSGEFVLEEPSASASGNATSLLGIDLDVTSFGSPIDGYVITYDSGSGEFILEEPSATSSGDATSLLGIDLDATSFGSPIDGYVITYDNESAEFILTELPDNLGGDATSLLGIDLDTTSFGSPIDGYAIIYDNESAEFILAELPDSLEDGAAGTVLAGGSPNEFTANPQVTSISLGGTVASTGDIRMGSSASIVGRTAGGSDFPMIGIDSDTLVIGEIAKLSQNSSSGPDSLDLGRNTNDFAILYDGVSALTFTDGSSGYTNIAFVIEPSNSSWNSGDGVLFIGDANTAPNAVDENGAFLWSDGTTSELCSHRARLTDYLSIGTDVSSEGSIRVTDDFKISGRSANGVSDRDILTWSNSDPNFEDTVIVGDLGNNGLVFGAGSTGVVAGIGFVLNDFWNMRLCDGYFELAPQGNSVPTDGTIRLEDDSVMVFGLTTADAGTIRLPNNEAIAWRNSIDSANATISYNDSNILALNASDDGYVKIQIDSNDELVVSPTRATFTNQLSYDVVHSFGGTVQTTDATETELTTYTPGVSKAGRLSFVVVAKSGTSTNVYSFAQSYETNGSGNVTLLGSLSTVAEDEDDADWSVALDTDGTDIVINVTGDASSTINWTVSGQIMIA